METELDKLRNMLDEKEIPYNSYKKLAEDKDIIKLWDNILKHEEETRKLLLGLDVKPKCNVKKYEINQVIICNETKMISFISQLGSYGWQYGLIEAMVFDISSESNDEPIPSLTAELAFQMVEEFIRE